jgi:hypothetical protein
MALRLERAGWGSADGWVRNQGAYDLWQARHREEIAAAWERFKVRLKAHRKTGQLKVSHGKTQTGQLKYSHGKTQTATERKAAAKTSRPSTTHASKKGRVSR